MEQKISVNVNLEDEKIEKILNERIERLIAEEIYGRMDEYIKKSIEGRLVATLKSDAFEQRLFEKYARYTITNMGIRTSLDASVSRAFSELISSKDFKEEVMQTVSSIIVTKISRAYTNSKSYRELSLKILNGLDMGENDESNE